MRTFDVHEMYQRAGGEVFRLIQSRDNGGKPQAAIVLYPMAYYFAPLIRETHESLQPVLSNVLASDWLTKPLYAPLRFLTKWMRDSLRHRFERPISEEPA